MACSDVYRTTYNAWIARGYTAAESITAATAAQNACMERSASGATLSQQYTQVSGGRLPDAQPISSPRLNPGLGQEK